MAGEEVASGRNSHVSVSKPHAVVVALPGQGHINPLLHLSKRLASEYDFSITFVNLDFTHTRVINSLQRQKEEEEEEARAQAGRAGVSHSSSTTAVKHLDIKFVGLPDGISAEATRTSDVAELCRGVVRSGPAFQRLLVELRPPATCIISDIFVEHTQDAANMLGIPRIAFWTQSAATFSAYVLAAKGLLPSDCHEETLIDNVAGAPSLRFKDLPSFLHKPDWLLDFSVRPFTRLQEAHCVLMNSFEALEGEALATLKLQMPTCRFHTIGPVLPVDYFSGRTMSKSPMNKAPSFWAEDYSCLEWLGTQLENSVLYVSFGSITELTEKELHEFAFGLEATGFPILWVLRPGVLEGGGRASLPIGFQERNRGRVFIVNWAPQLHVLAHPSVGAFFTHAGWNSILEGISQGKPLLAFPYFADQMMNGRCIQDFWGNGLAFERQGEGLLTRSLVENKARAVMSDPNLRNVALQLRDGARLAILSQDQGSPRTSNLIEFIDSLTLPFYNDLKPPTSL